MKRNKHLIIIGSILAAFILFIIFVYLPYADKQNKTTKFADALTPSENLREPVRQVPDFSFTNYDGRSITLNDLKNKVYVADFFYTSCPAQCPMMTTQLTKVQKAFENNDAFRIVSFSLDEKDPLSELASFAKEYKADSRMWYFLKGDEKKIFDIGEHGFMQIVKDETGRFEGHSQKFTLVDKNNMIRGFYLGSDSAEVANLINDINYLLNKEER